MKLLLIGAALLMVSCAKKHYAYTVVVNLKDSITYKATLETNKRTTPKMKLKNGCFFFDGEQLVCGATSYMIVDMERHSTRRVRY